MTIKNLCDLLKTVQGVSLKKLKSSTSVNPPYMVLKDGEKEYLGADIEVLYFTQAPVIELYTKVTDNSSEDKLTEVLISSNIHFTTSGDILIDGENVYVNYFYLENLINKI